MPEIALVHFLGSRDRGNDVPSRRDRRRFEIASPSADFRNRQRGEKKMLRNLCLCAVLITTSAFPRAGDGREWWPRIGTASTASNAVVFWNAVADNSIAVVGGKSPQQGSVEIAIVQIAVYDAVNAICGYPFTAYAVKPDVQVPALPEAAVAAAAHDVLVALYPAQAAALDQQYADYLGAIPGHHEGKLNGIAVGQQTAAGILALESQ